MQSKAIAIASAAAAASTSFRFYSIHDENNVRMHESIPKEEYDAAVRAVAAIVAASAAATASRRSLPVKRAREDSVFAPRKKARISSAPATSPAPASVRSCRSRSKPYRRSTRRRKNQTAAYFLANNGRKVFDRSFAAGMDAAITKGSAMDAAAARVKRKVSITAFAPPLKKARISSAIKESSLTAERSESEPLGSYWTTAPDRRGNMILVRRSHRLTHS